MTEEKAKGPNPFAPDYPGGGIHEYNIRVAGLPMPPWMDNRTLSSETFICKACLAYGLSLDSATRSISDRLESELLGIDLCPHCYDTEKEFIEEKEEGLCEDEILYGHWFQRKLHLIDLIILKNR